MLKAAIALVLAIALAPAPAVTCESCGNECAESEASAPLHVGGRYGRICPECYYILEICG